MARRQTARRLMMDRGEYSVFSGDLHGNTNVKQQNVTTQEYLTQLGREGWEMVSVVKTLSNALLSDEYTFFLKRRLD